MNHPESPRYVCGHSATELERLEIQGAFYHDISRIFLETAGLSQGMAVLDIGCGAGDLSLLAADIVGPSGTVLGVDRAGEAIAAATARAASRGLTQQVRFRVSEIAEFTPDSPVDALIGRFVLMHQTDPARTLRETVRHVRRGGLVAVLESHMSASVAGVHSQPYSPTYDRIQGWFLQVIRAAGANPDMGLELRQTFLAAGLPTPRLWLQGRVEGGAEADIYRYTIESLRSMLPVARHFGIVALSSEEVDDLERQLRQEVTASGGVLTSPLVVGAWTRLGREW